MEARKDKKSTYMQQLDLMLARKFMSEVAALAKKYNVPVFAVTRGASITRHDGDNPCEPVYLARQNQIEWEKENGFNPYEDWSKKK